METDDIRRKLLTLDAADHMVENVVATFSFPLVLLPHFVVNSETVSVAMVCDDDAVAKSCQRGAELAGLMGGFVSESTSPIMIGQIQVLDIPDLHIAAKRIQDEADDMVEWLNSKNPSTISRHSRAVGLKVLIQRSDVRALDGDRPRPITPMRGGADFSTLDDEMGATFVQLVIHVYYDCADAMGANIVNTACEALAPRIELLTGGRVNLCIMSNLSNLRLARAKCAVSSAQVDLTKFINIANLFAFDEVLAMSHNKEVMDAIDGVVVATGNDWRAIEAGAHAYAARGGRYTTLINWHLDAQDQLAGEIELPMAVGTVGGATRVLPMAQESLRLMRVGSARQLAKIAACVGLARSLDVIKSLALT